MKAVILAAGLGSRLRPITNEAPKCMVLINGIRIINKQFSKNREKHEIAHVVKLFPFTLPFTPKPLSHSIQ